MRIGPPGWCASSSETGRAPSWSCWSGFEKVQPADPPHYYLSLLGVHDDHRGKGIGMGLLRENIARFDREGTPTYLESSNAINNPRYEGLGYGKVGEFKTPDDSATITAYWRDPS